MFPCISRYRFHSALIANLDLFPDLFFQGGQAPHLAVRLLNSISLPEVCTIRSSSIGFAEIYQLLPGFIWFSGLYWVLLSFIEFY